MTTTRAILEAPAPAAVSGRTARVIFVNRVYAPSTAATAQLLTDLAEGLAHRGWPVHVVASGHSSAARHGVVVHGTGPGSTHGGLLSRSLNYRRFLRAARRELLALVEPGDLVVALTDPPMLGATVAEAARARGGRVVHWIQDIYPEIVSAHFGAIAALALRPLLARRDAAWRSAQACVTLGDDMAAFVTGRGVPAARVAIVPNWAPRELHAPAPADAVAARRAAWGVADKFVVAYSGNLGRVHEFDAVLGAAEALRAQPEISFVFVGTGARFDEVRRAARARRLENVRFLPLEPRAQLAAALAAADAHLVTLKPGFARLVYPSKLAGVLAAGRPVLFVGPPAGDIARLLARADCGVAVGPDGGGDLARAIGRWQAEPAARAALGRCARAAYEQNFAFETALDRWEAVLRGR